MGIVANSPYVKLLIDPFAAKLVTALGTTAAKVQSNKADAAITAWFGTGALSQKIQLATTVNRFRANLNLKTISVGFEAMKLDVSTKKFEREAGTNAAAFASNDANVSMALGSILAHVPRGEVPVELGEGFRSLPDYLPLVGGQIDKSAYNQSKFETLVHELSHLLLGTDDVDLPNGNTAYGTKRASKLAGLSTTQAFMNAENWGIFIEAVGVHGTS